MPRTPLPQMTGSSSCAEWPSLRPVEPPSLRHVASLEFGKGALDRMATAFEHEDARLAAGF